MDKYRLGHQDTKSLRSIKQVALGVFVPSWQKKIMKPMVFCCWLFLLLVYQPTLASQGDIAGKYLLAFHACEQNTCNDPRNHQVYLAESNDGASWSVVPGWTPHNGSVPDVVRRGDSLYLYSTTGIRRYRFQTKTWEDPLPVTLKTVSGAEEMYVDPSPIVDKDGRIVLFYLVGTRGYDPARCAPGETSCTKYFRSAVEVDGSDGTDFQVLDGNRLEIPITSQSSASDPDLFSDGSRYVMYISRGNSVQVYTSAELNGAYALLSGLPEGYLNQNTGGIPAGFYHAETRKYWTYVHIPQGNIQVIKRALHSSLSTPLTATDFTTVLTGADVAGLGPSWSVASPGFAVNESSSPISVKNILNTNTFKPRDTLVWEILVDGSGKADIYLAIVIPSGEFFTMESSGNFGPANKASPIISSWQITPGQYRVLAYSLSGIEPPGTYSLYALLVTAGKNPLERQNWLAVDGASFHIP